MIMGERVKVFFYMFLFCPLRGWWDGFRFTDGPLLNLGFIILCGCLRTGRLTMNKESPYIRGLEGKGAQKNSKVPKIMFFMTIIAPFPISLVHSRELTYPPKFGMFEDDFPFPVRWDMLGISISLVTLLKKMVLLIFNDFNEKVLLIFNRFNDV